MRGSSPPVRCFGRPLHNCLNLQEARRTECLHRSDFNLVFEQTKPTLSAPFFLFHLDKLQLRNEIYRLSPYGMLTVNNKLIPHDAGSLLWSYALGWLSLPGASAPAYQRFAALRLFGNDSVTSRSDRRLVASCVSVRNPTIPLPWSTSGASLL